MHKNTAVTACHFIARKNVFCIASLRERPNSILDSATELRTAVTLNDPLKRSSTVLGNVRLLIKYICDRINHEDNSWNTEGWAWALSRNLKHSTLKHPNARLNGFKRLIYIFPPIFSPPFLGVSEWLVPAVNITNLFIRFVFKSNRFNSFSHIVN